MRIDVVEADGGQAVLDETDDEEALLVILLLAA